MDFCLSNDSDKCFIEVKSVTLVEDGLALFPDAPTLRGTRHLKELIKIKEEGMRAISLFIIQREDATSFSPHETMDPLFASTLKEAQDAQVEVWAYKCRNTLDAVFLEEQVAVNYSCFFSSECVHRPQISDSLFNGLNYLAISGVMDV